MIDFKNVTKVYEPKITALKDINVHIGKGEFVFVWDIPVPVKALF